MKHSQAEIERQLNAIRQDYLASLASKRNFIFESGKRLRDNWDQNTYDTLFHVLHSLAGSAETFGLSTVTQNARELVQLLKHDASENRLGVDTFHKAESVLAQLLSSIDSGLQQPDPTK